jgi:hypothetical protein
LIMLRCRSSIGYAQRATHDPQNPTTGLDSIQA